MGDENVVDLGRKKIVERMRQEIGERFAEIAELDKTKISMKEYGEGVVTLANCVYIHPTTSGARICANVLLSTYNGDEFHFSLVDLCNLDINLYQAALAVIRGRVECRREPQTLIKNGDDVFGYLWENYEHLSVVNRAKRQCDRCYGDGKLYKTEEDEEQGRGEVCWKCEGRGWVWPNDDVAK